MRFTVEDATVALKYLVTCSQYYSQYIATTATQIIIYVLVDIFKALETKPEIIATFPQEFFVSLLDTIVIFLKNFNLNWNDSMETAYLTEITSKFLDIFPWSPKVSIFNTYNK